MSSPLFILFLFLLVLVVLLLDISQFDLIWLIADKSRDAFVQNAMSWLTSRKHAPPHVCYHAAFGHSALKGVGINTGEPQRWGMLKLDPLAWDGRRGWPHDAPPHMCYHVKFGSSATKGVRRNRKKPQNWGALGPRHFEVGGVANHIKTSAPPHIYHHVKFGTSA